MISQSEYAQRRQRLAESMADNSLCVVQAAAETTRSRDTEYPFRQDSDFLYLTGFNEPDALLLLEKLNGQLRCVLFCRPKDKLAEIWQGRRLGPDMAKTQLSMDEAYAIEDAADKLLDYLNGKSHLYFAQGSYPSADQLVFNTLAALRAAPKKGYKAPNTLVDVRHLIHEMRLFKSDAELSLMRRSAQISVDAHKRAMAFCGPGRYEYQLEAELHHEFAMQGARHPAYGTIVGSGENACILHYTQNSDELKAGDLVLIDAGAELDGYAADITRTFPVTGKFTEAQSELYNLVLKAQLAAFEQIKPGSTLVQATEVASRVITEGLLELGLLSGHLQQNLEEKTYRQFFMHGLGHWLGLDVHDVGDYKQEGEDRPFAPGMVLTVEPGIYVACDAEVDDKYKGIGIRIEDNLLITPNGFENLTVGAPKTIEEIETWMAQHR
ncbi:Xaa-Pro aminopeptidase [Aliiglaciecola sp. CAU 1673]|uniref:Xaa-Pro aminopeptidase n=1 Tax=Aliiglaciecola sp. CAU 1673 TaxID=3032595 RepID=UPI0023DA2B0C|nr:Xaa-Pro aminopeptidase [Aliiglaciecola sp. CAU 1673]MDF2179455.1 Xaa-Pro aminopeptidase [Aliiglaciecola sp. CAU 1673]